MKIAVKDLRPNPFRRIDKYPINRTKIESLVASINQTGFWDNVLARASEEGKYEIAYGHHRLHAIKEVGIKEVDIPVRVLSDETMIKIMANENMEDWELDTKVLDETVKVVKEFLVTRNEPTTSRNIKDFLGKNWPQRRVDEALANISGEYDEDAVESFKVPRHASAFRGAISQHEKAGMPIDKPTQRQIAKELIEEVSQEDEPELTSAKIREKVYEKAGAKAKAHHKGQRTALVLDAIYVQLEATLSRINAILNENRFTVVDVEAKNKDKVTKRVESLIAKLKEIIE